jgi:6-phosphogluconolactonase/glucosamine-6-phosphate isomerase/deaminase
MKRIFILAVLLLSFAYGNAQSPQKMSFQAVIRNSSNSLVSNLPIGLRVSILQGTPSGAIVYSETQTATTNVNGLVTIQIGGGNVIQGDFSTIEWANGPYFIQTETDVNGGANYTITSTTQLLSVPYALYAQTSGSSTPGPQGPAGANGAAGATGPQGPIGLTGPQGPSGQNGINGTNGIDGLSAYQIWLNNGNTGTVSQFLIALQGATGAQGPAGINGANGIDGATGLQGIQGPQGLTGAQGPAGENGIDGAVGPQGPQGPIGLTGPQGAQGSQGLTGLQGQAGQNGTNGGVGPQGPQGIQGVAGANGTNGVDGLSAYQIWLNSGNIGTESQFLASLHGAQGPQGIQGAPGQTGPAGAIGATGPQGTQGIQGPSGFLSNGNTTGNTTYWNGTQWVVNSSNIYNNGNEVGIGTSTPNISAKVEIASTTQGFLPPRMTTSQRDAISAPAIGLVIFNTTTNCLNFYIGSGWNEICGNSSIPTGTIDSINCSSSINTGTLTQGIEASGVSSNVPYIAGNGGSHSGQTLISTGVSGLTATLQSGTFANGSGNLNYIITGTPTSSGTASFALNIGGQGCTLTIAVASNLEAQYLAGSVFCNGPTAIIDVTNPTTGKIWMDRNLGASQVATSSTDALAYGDLYQWGRGNDGHQCRNSSTTSVLSSTDQPANGSFITASSPNNDWRSPQNNNLWQGVNGVNNPCPSGYRLPTETELNAEITSWSQNNSEGAFSSPLKFTKGGNRSGDVVDDVGTIGRYSSSTVDSTISKYLLISGSAFMSNTLREFGISVRCIKDASAIPPTVGTLNCGSTSIIGTLTSGTAASGVSASVPYTSGNSGSYLAQSFSSTGVTGLTATLTSGNLANGSGSLSFAISGTPSTSGSAIFALTIGGQTCSFTISVQPALALQYPVSSVFCASGPTAIVDVTNPTTGKVWMDRNLGASQAATSSTDTAAYGDLYQWGRGSDGHQCRNSSTTSTLSSTDQPANSLFIIVSNSPGDWRNPQNSNLWQGVNGINNPCPNGYRIPTIIELNAELSSWSNQTSSGAFASPLKFTVAGQRLFNNGTLVIVGNVGLYHSSTYNGGVGKQSINFDSTSANLDNSSVNAYGNSVRCIKDASAIPATVGALNCGSTSVTGTLTNGTAASGVSAEVAYTGGNGGSYATQSISSTGVTGITATLTSGILANGSGSFSFAIFGTPSTSGTASFALTLGGQSCSFTVNVIPNYATQYPTNSVFCASGPTVILDVTNPTTGKTWMDRNLGASQAATSSTDASAYGDLYQWGRGNDGHQCRNSSITSTLSSSDQPANGSFITTTTGNLDWRSTLNNNLWQGVNGVNNPCPNGYRLPTSTELNNERLSWSSQNSSGAFVSVLKIPLAGRRDVQNGLIDSTEISASLWSSSPATNFTRQSDYLILTSNALFINTSTRGAGFTVRCIKN